MLRTTIMFRCTCDRIGHSLHLNKPLLLNLYIQAHASSKGKNFDVFFDNIQIMTHNIPIGMRTKKSHIVVGDDAICHVWLTPGHNDIGFSNWVFCNISFYILWWCRSCGKTTITTVILRTRTYSIHTATKYLVHPTYKSYPNYSTHSLFNQEGLWN